VNIATRLRAVFCCLFVFAAVPLFASPVMDGVVNAAEYRWSSGDWRMDHDETYLYLAKINLPTGAITLHLDTDPRSTPTAGSGANGNLDPAEINLGGGAGYTPKLPFRADVRAVGGLAAYDLKVRDGAGGWTNGNPDDFRVSAGLGNNTVELRLRWAGLPGLTGRPASFNWAAHQVINAGGTTGTNPMPAANTSNGPRIEYFFHVPSTSSPTDTFSDQRSLWLVTNSADSGAYSLRSSLDSVNNDATSSRRYVAFDFGGIQNLDVATALPLITRSNVTIDGTAASGYDGQSPVVRIFGPGDDQGVNGLSFLDVSNAEVKGLAVSDFATGIVFDGGNFNTVSASWIGILGANLTGIRMLETTNSIVGGYQAADQNLIGLNTTGISLDSTSDAQIYNNRIGVDGSDTQQPNFNGVELISTTNTVIGGVALGNVISANQNAGIVSDATSNASISGNLIGVGGDGTTAKGNGGAGIDGGANLIIGALAAPNIIANNGGAGIDAAGGNTVIRFNQIYDNDVHIQLTNGQPMPTVVQGSVGDGTTLGIRFSIASNNHTATANSYRLDLYDDDGGPRQLLAASPCFTGATLTNTNWTAGTGYSAGTDYNLIATSYADTNCIIPADGSSEVRTFEADTGVAPTVTLISSSATAWTGGSVTLTVSVTAATTPTGTITFRNGDVPIAHCTNLALSANSPYLAQCLVPFDSNGTFNLTAHYNGDGFNAATTSNTVDVTAATHTFTGSGAFTDTSLWSGNVLPGAGENMRIEGNCVVVSTTGVAYGSAEVILNGNLSFGGGSFTLRLVNVTGSGFVSQTGGGTLELSGSLASSIVFSRGTGTIRFTGNAILPPNAYNNVVITGAVTGSSGNSTIHGALTVGAGASMTTTHGLTVRGSIVNNGSLHIGVLDIPAGVTVTANGSFTAGQAYVDGTLIPGATTVVGGTSLFGTGSVWVTSLASPSSFRAQYTFTNKTLSALDVAFRGEGMQSIDPIQYGRLTMNNLDNATLAPGTADVSGTLTLTSGIILTDGGTADLYVSNSAPSAVSVLTGAIAGSGFHRRIATGTNSYLFPVGYPAFGAFSTVTTKNVLSQGWINVAMFFEGDLGAPEATSGVDVNRDLNALWRISTDVAAVADITLEFNTPSNPPDAAGNPNGYVFRTYKSTGGNATWLNHTATIGPSSITGHNVSLPAASVHWITAGNQLASAPHSEITTALSAIVADGVASTKVTVRLRDLLGLNLVLGSDTVELFTTAGMLTSVTDNQNGTYTATIRSYNAGSATITGTVNGVTITDNAVVKFNAPIAGSGVKGDFNGDAKSDLVWQNSATGRTVVWLMNDITYTGEAELPTVGSSNWSISGVDDFNSDGRSDVVWRNAATFATVVWLMNGTTYVGEASLPGVSSAAWRIAGAGDFNGDGKADLVWQNATTFQTVVWLLNGTTYIGQASLPGVSSPDWSIRGVGDFNGDGGADLVWRNSKTFQTVVWLMNGTTYAGEAALPGVSSAAWQIDAIGDYNHDGNSDLVWRNSSTFRTVVWLMNRTTYVGEGTLPGVSSASWAVVGPK